VAVAKARQARGALPGPWGEGLPPRGQAGEGSGFEPHQPRRPCLVMRSIVAFWSSSRVA
jgi:hypothetical protein